MSIFHFGFRDTGHRDRANYSGLRARLDAGKAIGPSFALKRTQETVFVSPTAMRTNLNSYFSRAPAKLRGSQRNAQSLRR